MTEHTLEERLAYALYTREHVHGAKSLEAHNEQLLEVKRNFRRLLSSNEAQDFIKILGDCGLKLSLAKHG